MLLPSRSAIQIESGSTASERGPNSGGRSRVGAIGRQYLFTCPADRLDLAAGKIDPPQSMIDRVGDQQPAGAIKHDTVGLLKLHLRSRLSVAGKTRLTIAGNRGDNSSARVNATDHMIASICDVQVAFLIGSHLVRPIERCVDCNAAIAAVATDSRASNANKLIAIGRTAVDAMIIDRSDPQRVLENLDSERIADLDLRWRARRLTGRISLVSFG